MEFLRFLVDTPAVAFLLLLVLLITVGPIVALLLSRRKAVHSDSVDVAVREPPTTRFLGTQLDLAILVLAFLVLLAFGGWLYKVVLE